MATILVAEDEASIRLLVETALSSAGHQILSAVNGLEAIALFRSFPESIDLIVTDLSMPVMDGYELVRLIREDRPDARIICMSGYFERGNPPGTAFLSKPFLPKQICDTVEQAMHRPVR